MPKIFCIMQIRAMSQNLTHNPHNYWLILYQFFVFTQNLKQSPIKTPTPFIITFTIIHLHIHRKIQCFFSSIFSFLLYQVKIELFFVWVLFCTDVNFLFLLVVIFLFNSYCGIAFPRRSFLQDNVYMEQRYREASGRSFYIDYKFRIEIIFVFQSHWYFIIQFTHSFSKIKFILLCLFNEFKSFSIYSHVSLYDPSTATDSSEINWINSSDFPSYFSWAGSWQWQLQKDHG